MSFQRVIRENWLTRKIPTGTFNTTIASVFLLLAGTAMFLNNIGAADTWMPASGRSVFQQHEYWRAWTALFAHADAGHILSNLFLYFPFAYFLSGYFGRIFFPIIGFFMGGIVNLLVLKTMPLDASIIGASGVVHWMGAAWITLATLVDRRDSRKKRLMKAIAVSALLFIPESYKPEVSYMAHGVGYLLGALSGVALYALYRKRFHEAEVIEYICNEDECDGGSEITHSEPLLSDKKLLHIR